MTSEPSIDLSADGEYFDEHSQVASTISDMLMEAADAYELPLDERDALQIAMDETAVLILAELGFTITGKNPDGTVSAILYPKGLES